MKENFLKWLNEKYPKFRLTKIQMDMLDVIFLGKTEKNFARQVGKSTIIELISEYYRFLLNDDRFYHDYQRTQILLRGSR